MNETRPEEDPLENRPQETPGPIPEAEPTLNWPAPEPGRRFKPYMDFAFGFLAWFLVNGLLWYFILGGTTFSFENEGILIYNGGCFFPLNLGIMLLLLRDKQTRRVGQGIFGAVAVNMVLSVVLGAVTNAACLVPFFYR